MAADRGLDGAVQFRGNVTSEERDEWLDCAHVFAMPSRLRPGGGGGEGFGIVYLEANAHGLPCVGGNVAGALDAVVDGETGLLVDPRDHVAVADAIGGLLLDRERAERMGSAGAERAAEYSWPKVSSRVEDLLLDAIGKA
jgi:phosphatidylinositol alpha-1,6-mannosyltransferase